MSAPTPLAALLPQLTDAAWTTAALSAFVESGALDSFDRPLTPEELGARVGAPPAMLGALLDVIVAQGLARRGEGGRVELGPELAAARGGGLAARVLRDDLRRIAGQPAALVAEAREGRLAPGWRHLDAALIDAQGTFAELHTDLLFVRGIVPRLGDLDARLRRDGGRVLDVGAGAAGNAIGFCRAWPAVTVTGLEPWAPSRARGERRIAEEGLGDRIALRDQRVEDLDEAGVYDLVWLPQMFLDDATFGRALRTCRRALRPGGWLVSAWIADEAAPGVAGALARLRDLAFGGAARGRATLERRLAEAGFEACVSVPLGAGAIGTVGGRAP